MRSLILENTKKAGHINKVSLLCNNIMSYASHVIYDKSSRYYECTVNVPSRISVHVKAKAVDEIMPLAFKKVQSVILEVPSVDEWPLTWLNLLPKEFKKVPSSFVEAHLTSANAAKAPLLTIGVTSKDGFEQRINLIAEKNSSKFSETARSAFIQGLELFNNKLDYENAEKVVKQIESRALFLNKGKVSREWMLRIDKKNYIRAKVLANELGLSMSKVAMLCISLGVDSL